MSKYFTSENVGDKILKDFLTNVRNNRGGLLVHAERYSYFKEDKVEKELAALDTLKVPQLLHLSTCLGLKSTSDKEALRSALLQRKAEAEALTAFKKYEMDEHPYPFLVHIGSNAVAGTAGSMTSVGVRSAGMREIFTTSGFHYRSKTIVYNALIWVPKFGDSVSLVTLHMLSPNEEIAPANYENGWKAVFEPAHVVKSTPYCTEVSAPGGRVAESVVYSLAPHIARMRPFHNVPLKLYLSLSNVKSIKLNSPVGISVYRPQQIPEECALSRGVPVHTSPRVKATEAAVNFPPFLHQSILELLLLPLDEEGHFSECLLTFDLVNKKDVAVATASVAWKVLCKAMLTGDKAVSVPLKVAEKFAKKKNLENGADAPTLHVLLSDFSKVLELTRGESGMRVIGRRDVNFDDDEEMSSHRKMLRSMKLPEDTPILYSVEGERDYVSIPVVQTMNQKVEYDDLVKMVFELKAEVQATKKELAESRAEVAEAKAEIDSLKSKFLF